MCGTQHGGIDYEWLISNLEVGDVAVGVDEEGSGSVQTFVLGPKAIYAAESYLLGLFQLYPTVYLHKATRGAEKLFSELLVRIFTLVLNGKVGDTGLPRSHPLIAFAKNSNRLDGAQALDDFVFWGSLELMSASKDKVVANLSRRLRDRQLYKSIEIFDDTVLKEAHDSGDKDFLEKIYQRMEETLKVHQSNEGIAEPRVLLDRVRRPLYKEFDKSKGPLNQILIKRQGGALVDVKEVSPVIRAIIDFQNLRAYVRPGDLESREEVLALAKEAKEYARAS